MSILTPLLHFFFPNICIHCGYGGLPNQEVFCAKCTMEIPFTDFESIYQNEMSRRLIALNMVKSSFAAVYFKKDGTVQDLMHRIKYGNRSDIAYKLGLWLGLRWLKIAGDDSPVEAVSFIPIHSTKLAQRKYNQSERIAAGVAKSLNLPLLDVFERNRITETQTHFGRKQRLLNQSGSMNLRSKPTYQHLMIVDDVLTTGSTISVCEEVLAENDLKIELSILTFALADHW